MPLTTPGRLSDIGVSPDIVFECTGVVDLVRQAAESASPGGIVCLTGVGGPQASSAWPAAGLATQAVLKNLVLFGTVNANRRHYYRAAKVLAAAKRSWLERLITRRVPPESAAAGPGTNTRQHQSCHGVQAITHIRALLADGGRVLSASLQALGLSGDASGAGTRALAINSNGSTGVRPGFHARAQ